MRGAGRFPTWLTPPRATSQNGVAGGRVVMKTAKIGRNDPCPCGSGKKYKQCCEGKAAEKTTFLTKWIAVIVGMILVLLVAVGTAASFFTDDQSNNAPPRRVWSPEHGHWHNVDGAGTRSAARSVPRPAGPAPPGKVWSPDHGHWHDAR